MAYLPCMPCLGSSYHPFFLPDMETKALSIPQGNCILLVLSVLHNFFHHYIQNTLGALPPQEFRGCRIPLCWIQYISPNIPKYILNIKVKLFCKNWKCLTVLLQYLMHISEGRESSSLLKKKKKLVQDFYVCVCMCIHVHMVCVHVYTCPCGVLHRCICVLSWVFAKYFIATAYKYLPMQKMLKPGQQLHFKTN